MRANSGERKGKGKKKKETYNAVLRQHRWNVNTSFLIPNLRTAAKGAACEASGQLSDKQSCRKSAVLSYRTSNLERLSEINALEFT